MKNIIGRVLGLSLCIFALLGGVLVDYGNFQLRGHIPTGFWVGVLLLGLYIKSAAEASELRTLHNVDTKPLNAKNYITVAALAAAFVVGIIWFA